METACNSTACGAPVFCNPLGALKSNMARRSSQSSEVIRKALRESTVGSARHRDTSSTRRYSSPNSLLVEHYKARQAVVLARAARVSNFASERAALRRLEEWEIVREALRSEVEDSRSDRYKVRQALNVAKAVRATLLAEEMCARERLKEAELHLNAMRDAVEEAGFKLNEATQQVKEVWEMLSAREVLHDSDSNSEDNYKFKPTRLTHFPIPLFGHTSDASEEEQSDLSDAEHSAEDHSIGYHY